MPFAMEIAMENRVFTSILLGGSLRPGFTSLQHTGFSWFLRLCVYVCRIVHISIFKCTYLM